MASLADGPKWSGPKRSITCPHCGATIIDNAGGRFPCSFCDRLNVSPTADEYRAMFEAIDEARAMRRTP